MNIKVLIVDDEKGIRTIIKKILDKSGGFDIVGDTDSGEEAIGILRSTILRWCSLMLKCLALVA